MSWHLLRPGLMTLVLAAALPGPAAADTAVGALRPVTLTVTKQPSPSVEKMTLRDRGETTIIYWPKATARGGVELVIDNCLRFGQQCGQPAADATCRRLTPQRPVATKFLTAKPRGGATVVLGSDMNVCWDKVCVGFSEVHCARTTAAAAPQPAPAPAPAPSPPPDPRTCKPGFVWRVANASDLVCVTPESRQRVASENASAASRVDPRGAYGPASCVAGFVWREAFAGDTVCVAPEVRSLVRDENRLAASRRVGP